MAGDDDHRNAWLHAPNEVTDAQPAARAQPEIREHHVVEALAQSFGSLRFVLSTIDLGASAFQQGSQEFAHVLLVVDQQNASIHFPFSSISDSVRLPAVRHDDQRFSTTSS